MDPEGGTPQGAVISPLLSNIYLDPLDQLMAEAGVRDGAVCRRLCDLCRSQAEAAAALDRCSNGRSKPD